MSLLTQQDRARIRQAALLGLARQPLTPPAALAAMLDTATASTDPARTLLALAAQQQRFERPAHAATVEAAPAARQMHDDARPIVAPPLRRALIRLSNAVAKMHTGIVLQSAVARTAAAGLRPHPFDLPWLMSHIKGHVACLGLAERAYLALTEKADTDARGTVLHAAITPENWTDFPRGHRRDFLSKRRAGDADAARALLEQVWKSEPAPVRGELLEALSVGLKPDDLPFLESLASDRADSVKAVATRLMARVPGTPAFDQRLAAAAACFQKSGGVKSLMNRFGLGTSGDVTFVPPKGTMTGQTAATQRVAATAALFDGLTLDGLATATGFSSAQLLAALGDDDTVVAALMATAAANRDEAAHMMLFDHIVHALLSASDFQAYSLVTLHGLARGPMTVSTADRLLASPAWSGLIARLSGPEMVGRDDGALLYAALLLPNSVMPQFIAALEPVQSAGAREARAFAELVLAIPAQS